MKIPKVEYLISAIHEHVRDADCYTDTPENHNQMLNLITIGIKVFERNFRTIEDCFDPIELQKEV